MSPTGDFFLFLDGVLNILIIDPDRLVHKSMYDAFFSGIPCCNVFYAYTLSDALTHHLESGKRYHVCITELGMGDSEHDEFYVLRHYGMHCSVAVVTNDTSPAKGAHCIELGARGVFDKGAGFNWPAFYGHFCSMLLINIINHRFDSRSADSVTNATKVLFAKNPATVTEWANEMRITDRQLRNLWHSGSGFGAKQMHFLYECFKNALLYYGQVLFPDEENLDTKELFCKKRLPTYFKAHREVLLYILS